MQDAPKRKGKEQCLPQSSNDNDFQIHSFIWSHEWTLKESKVMNVLELNPLKWQKPTHTCVYAVWQKLAVTVIWLGDWLPFSQSVSLTLKGWVCSTKVLPDTVPPQQILAAVHKQDSVYLPSSANNPHIYAALSQVKGEKGLGHTVDKGQRSLKQLGNKPISVASGCKRWHQTVLFS